MRTVCGLLIFLVSIFIELLKAHFPLPLLYVMYIIFYIYYFNGTSRYPQLHTFVSTRDKCTCTILITQHT